MLKNILRLAICATIVVVGAVSAKAFSVRNVPAPMPGPQTLRNVPAPMPGPQTLRNVPAPMPGPQT